MKKWVIGFGALLFAGLIVWGVFIDPSTTTPTPGPAAPSGGSATGSGLSDPRIWFKSMVPPWWDRQMSLIAIGLALGIGFLVNLIVGKKGGS